jgi:hypothetical protein
MESCRETSKLQQCSEMWVTELSRAAEELNGAAKQIQAQFASASERAVSRGYVDAAIYVAQSDDYDWLISNQGATFSYHYPFSQDPIPDLTSMIRRIQQLETTMTHLQLACKELAEKRKVVLPEAYEKILANQKLLSQVSAKRVGCIGVNSR